RWRRRSSGSRIAYCCSATGTKSRHNWPQPADLGPFLERVPLFPAAAYDAAMSRIGAFADDDVTAFAVKSPELGTALANFSHAVYTKGRLPLRVREAARIVIAHANECVVCQNTRDSEGAAAGIDEEFYDHAGEWRTWPGYSDAERIAMEFAYR